MKHWIHLPVAALVAALIGAASAFLGTSARTSAARETSSDAAALAATLEELRTEQRALAERVERLASTPSAATPVASRAPAQDLDQAIAAYMARQLGAAEDDTRASDGAPADPESAAIADRILSGEVRGKELQALWQRLRDEKRIDGVVAEIERQAALAPNDPDLQTELGHAYIQKLFDVGMGPMAATWSEKAQRAFDRALELDDTHWNARFSKALSLANAPAFLGRQGEAMRQFEILMEQQERAAPSPEQAETYRFLGNLYAQNGEQEKALATWRRGLERFPDDADLLAKTGGAR